MTVPIPTITASDADAMRATRRVRVRRLIHLESRWRWRCGRRASRRTRQHDERPIGVVSEIASRAMTSTVRRPPGQRKVAPSSPTGRRRPTWSICFALVLEVADVAVMGSGWEWALRSSPECRGGSQADELAGLLVSRMLRMPSPRRTQPIRCSLASPTGVRAQRRHIDRVGTAAPGRHRHGACSQTDSSALVTGGVTRGPHAALAAIIRSNRCGVWTPKSHRTIRGHRR